MRHSQALLICKSLAFFLGPGPFAALCAGLRSALEPVPRPSPIMPPDAIPGSEARIEELTRRAYWWYNGRSIFDQADTADTLRLGILLRSDERGGGFGLGEAKEGVVREGHAGIERLTGEAVPRPWRKRRRGPRKRRPPTASSRP